MLVSTKGRYALRVLLALAAQNQDGKYLRLDSIAESEEISEKYLENIVHILVQENMIQGHRGRGGGYKLVRPPEEYTIGEILRLTEGTLAPVACLNCTSNPCPRAASCKTLKLWTGLNSLIEGYLDNTTLADLLDEDGCPAPILTGLDKGLQE